MTANHPALIHLLMTGARQLPLPAPLSEATAERLVDYVLLLSKWNAVYNLTAVRDPAKMVTQHLLDSLALVPAITGARHMLDVGAGGGLPGMVVAIWAAEARPAMQVAMVDTVHKKTAFLTQARAELGLANVTVHTCRVESLPATTPFDVIVSRAFADLADFINWSGHLLAEGGRFVAMKGVLPQSEIAGIPAGWAVTEIMPVQVPGLDAQRHLIIIERETA